MFVAHIAGPVENGLQRCARCGITLIDYRGKHLAVVVGANRNVEGPSYWPEQSFVGSAGCGYFLMSHDAKGVDEVPCGRIQ